MDRYKNMQKGLRWDVPVDFLRQYDADRLKCLNGMLRRAPFTAEEYMAYITYFMADPEFDRIYRAWSIAGKPSHLKPSLDHKVPTSKGGTWDLKNLQIITWGSNRAKGDSGPEATREIASNVVHDALNPDYYKRGCAESIDIIDSYGLDFELGNVIKYVLRAGYKDPEKHIQDLEKALWYLNREIYNLRKARGQNELGDQE